MTLSVLSFPVPTPRQSQIKVAEREFTPRISYAVIELETSEAESATRALPRCAPHRVQVTLSSIILAIVGMMLLLSITDYSSECPKALPAHKDAEMVLEERVPHIPSSLERLYDEIQNASGELPEKVEHPDNKVNAPAGEDSQDMTDEERVLRECRAKYGIWEPLVRVGKYINPLTIPQRLGEFLKYARDFASKPSWHHAVEMAGFEDIKCRPVRSAPSYRDCKDNGILTTQRIMGASCLFFCAPGMYYLYYVCVVGGTIPLATKIIAGAVSILLAYISTISFLADYWYTGDDEFRSNPTIPECQKQAIFNKIDLTNVPFIGMSCIGVGCVFSCYGKAYAWATPALFLSFCGAIYVQQISSKYLKSYTDVVYEDDGTDKNGYDRSTHTAEVTHNIWMGLNLHIVWHIIGAALTVIQMYLLLNVGMTLPSWMSCGC